MRSVTDIITYVGRFDPYYPMRSLGGRIIMPDEAFPRSQDIGLVMSSGAAITTFPSEAIVLAQGTTCASLNIPKVGYLGVDIALAGGPTFTAVVNNPLPISEPVLHNPMMAFWMRAVMYYEARKQLAQTKGYSLRFDDYALIISDLGQSLYMLFGRHWNDDAKARYAKAVGTTPADTPDLLALLEKHYPSIGWDLPGERPELWTSLRAFIHEYYQDIVKHFEFNKFQRVLQLDIGKLSSFMECTRQTWIWFIEKVFGILFDPGKDEFREFKNVF